MPYSSDSGKRLVDRTILRLTKQLPSLFKTNVILDLGTGSGTYSDRYSRTLLPRKQFSWVGVEIWEPYVEKFGLKKKYDDLFLVDVCHFMEDLPSISYDVCFLGDVLEHMSKDSAIKLVQNAVDQSRAVIISIPLGHYPQEEFEGNPYEKHVKDDWTHAEVMSSFPNIVFYGIEKEIGVYVCSKLDTVEKVLRPQIGVYVICKNECEFIDRMYKSVKDADHIQICDTGSTDDTPDWLFKFAKEKAHERSENVKWEGTFHEYTSIACTGFSAHRITVAPWRFDDARNVALALLPDDLDICISIDVDELMEPGWYPLLQGEVLKDLHEQGHPYDRYFHRFSTIWNWREVEAKPLEGNTLKPVTPSFSEHWHERIHSRLGYIWKLPVHEVLVKGDASAEQIKWLGGIKMIQKPDGSKSRPYLPLIEQAIAEDPKRWKLYSFYANDLIAAKRFDDGIKAIKTALEIPDSDVAHLHHQLARAYQAQGKMQEAINEMINAACINSSSREYKVYVSQLYRDTRQFKRAKTWLTMAREITEKSSGYSFDPSCWGDALDKYDETLKEAT